MKVGFADLEQDRIINTSKNYMHSLFKTYFYLYRAGGRIDSVYLSRVRTFLDNLSKEC
jgi:hypothetical protein